MQAARADAGRVRIAIAAPYPAVRAGLRALLAGTEDMEVVAEAAHPGDFGRDLSGEVDAVVVDLDPEGAWQAVLDGAALAPEVGLILLGPVAAIPAPDSSYPSEGRLVELMGNRAWAYLLKEADGAELIAAIGAVVQGLVVLQPPLVQRLLEPAVTAAALDPPGAESLTPREQEVLQLVAEGLANKTVALRLRISEHTVKFHITSILGKLGAGSRTEAVRLGARRGLIVL